MTIDWNAEIETDEAAPERLIVIPSFTGHFLSTERVADPVWTYDELGEPLGNAPRIRNVRPKPETPAQTYDPALVERMVGLVRSVCADGAVAGHVLRNEAFDIAKMLPEPADEDAADMAAAKSIVRKWREMGGSEATLALVGIMRGRELEREGK